MEEPCRIQPSSVLWLSYWRSKVKQSNLNVLISLLLRGHALSYEIILDLFAYLYLDHKLLNSVTWLSFSAFTILKIGLDGLISAYHPADRLISHTIRINSLNPIVIALLVVECGWNSSEPCFGSTTAGSKKKGLASCTYSPFLPMRHENLLAFSCQNDSK